MARMKAGNAPYMGFDKEPPSAHGPKEAGRALAHSHSARPKTKVMPSKRHGRKR
jgi:hypothetical protein